MADLVKEFFRRDLTDVEVKQLEELLESSDDACLRLAKTAKKAYLKTGLPTPMAPGGGGGPNLGGSGEIWLGLRSLILWGTALTGITVSALFWHAHSALPAAPPVETVHPAAKSIPIKAHLSAPHLNPKPVPVVAPAPKPTSPPSALPNQGLVEPMAYVPGKEYGGLSVIVQQAADDLVTVRVLDSARAEVRTLYAGLLAKGTWTFTWDGKLSDGRQAGIGSYWVEVEAGGKTLNKEIKIGGRPSSRPNP